MKRIKPTYRQLEKRLAAAEPVVAALKRQEVDAVVGEEKIAFLLLRKVEEAWLESNGEFTAMFNLGGIGMIQADTPAFRFTRVNSKFCEITGYSAEELLKRSYLELTHAQDRKRDLAAVARVIRGKSNSWSIEKRCIRKDGRVIWAGVHGVALRDHAGRAIMIMAMIEDVSARKQAEQAQLDALAQLRRQLHKRTAEVSQLLGLFRSQVAKLRPADLVLRAIQKFVDRANASASEKSSASGRKPIRRKKAALKTSRKSAARRMSGRRRPRSR